MLHAFILLSAFVLFTHVWILMHGVNSPVSEPRLVHVSQEWSTDGVRRSDAVVGPLNKAQYVFSLNGFKFHEAFPDIETKAFGFSIDPQARPPSAPPTTARVQPTRVKDAHQQQPSGPLCMHEPVRLQGH